MEFKLTTLDRTTAELFADARMEDQGNFYKKVRGAFKREDVLIGAMGEIGAFYYLTAQGIDVSYPDFKIYKKKSFKEDLTDGTYKFHVKAQSKESARKYGVSYLFQKEDKLVTAPQDNSFIICTVVDLETNIVTIQGDFAATDIVWGKPKIDWLARTKVALYVKEQA